MADAPGPPADAAAPVPPLSGETSGAPEPTATASGASGSGGGSGAAGRAGARVRGRPAAPTSSSSGGSGPPVRAPYDPPDLKRDAIVARRLIRYMIYEGLWTGGVPPDLFADQVAPDPEAPADAPELAPTAPEVDPDGPGDLGIRSRSRSRSSMSGDEQDATGGDF